MKLSLLKDKISDRANQVQFAKFLVTGGTTVTADFVTFFILINAGVDLVIVNALSLAAGFVVSFSLNKLWVFGAKNGKAQQTTTKQFLMYALLFAFNLVLSSIFISQLVNYGVHPYAAKAMAIAIITVWNFIAYKKLIFRLGATT